MDNRDTRDTHGPPPKRRPGRLADLGPVWITALATLIAALAAAGFFTGRATATGSPTPARTVIVTVTATPPTSSSVGSQQTSSPGNGNSWQPITSNFPPGMALRSAPLLPHSPSSLRVALVTCTKTSTAWCPAMAAIRC